MRNYKQLCGAIASDKFVCKPQTLIFMAGGSHLFILDYYIMVDIYSPSWGPGKTIKKKVFNIDRMPSLQSCKSLSVFKFKTFAPNTLSKTRQSEY